MSKFCCVLKDDLQHWQTVFLLAGGGYFAGNVIYVIFASGEVQPWNDASTRAVKSMNEIEREANSLRNVRNRGNIILIGLFYSIY